MAQPCKYTQLSAPRYTRVIKLLPSTKKNSLLRIELAELSIDDPPVYKALSYTWGGQASDQQVICDGMTLYVTSNAQAALKRLRGIFRSCNIWVDAICIDQSSTEEKNIQVPLMTDIYSKASSVVAWLGEGNADRNEAFKLIHNVDRISLSAAKLLYTWDIGASIKKRETVMKMEAPYEAGIRQLSDDHPYWTRIWTIQEVALNPSCQVYCGDSKPVSFEAFFKALGFVDQYVAEDTKEGAQNSEGDYRTACQMHFFSHKKLHNRDGDILFSALAEKKATDARDLIYGIRAIYPNILGSVPVDYGNNIRTVFSQAAATMVKTQNSVSSVLYYACRGPRNQDVPSWVPDWTCISARHGKYPSDSSRVKFKQPIYRFSDDSLTLFLKGQTIDSSLTLISDPFPAFPSSRQDQWSWYARVRTLILQWLSSRVNLMKKDEAVIASLLACLPTHPVPHNVHQSGLYCEVALWSLLWPGINLEHHLIPWLQEEVKDIPKLDLELMEGHIRKFEGCSLIMTAQGYIGRCRDTRTGDLLTYLTGCVEPFTLRPQGDGTFRLGSPVILREVHTQQAPDLGDQNLVEYCIV